MKNIGDELDEVWYDNPETVHEREQNAIKFVMHPVYESLKRIQLTLESRLEAKAAELPLSWTSENVPIQGTSQLEIHEHRCGFEDAYGSLRAGNIESSQQEEIVREELTRIGNFIVAYEPETEKDPSRQQLW